MILAGILLVTIQGVAHDVLAHQDTIFSIASDGRLSRIPDDYGPVFIRLEGTADSPRVSLEIPARRVSLPSCLARLFLLPKGETIRAKGSWYHSRSLLPPYVSFDLPRETIANGFYTGYSLLFNLETGELIELSQHTAMPDGNGVRMRSLEVGSPCDPDEPLRLRAAPLDAPISAIELIK